MQKTNGHRQPVQPAVSMGARTGHKQPLARLHADGKLCSRAASCNRNTTSVLLLRVSPTRESQANIKVRQKWCGLADSAFNSTTTVGASCYHKAGGEPQRGSDKGAMLVVCRMIVMPYALCR